jgi:hypothetical protein
MKKRGRPRKPQSEVRDVILRHRLTKGQYRDLCAAAKKAGLSVSEYARKKIGS